MLPEKDKLDYKKSVLEVVTEIGRPVLFYPRIRPTPLEDDIYEEDIYGEKEHLIGEPITFVAEVSPMEPTPDSLNTIQTMGKALFNLSIPQLLFEEKHINPYLMTDGHFEFDNCKYKVLDIIPEGGFTDFYTSYKFKTQMI